MIKQVIFDIGNVLVDFHPQQYFEVAMPNKHMTEICALVFDEVWLELDRGTYLQDKAMQIHLERHPEYEEQIRFIYTNWLSMMHLKEDTYAYMKDLISRGYEIYLLSNIGEESHAYLSSSYDFFTLANGMVLSYQEYCLKPDREIYEILLERYGLKAEECIFFDDNSNNIDMARSLGMHGVVFHNVEQAKKEIASVW